MIDTKKIAIGTANFGQEYNGVLVPPDEQAKIWDYCRKVGIDMVDTAVAYGKIDIPDDFKVIDKIRAGDSYPKQRYRILAHYAMDYCQSYHRGLGLLDGVSLYYPAEISIVIFGNPRILQMPYGPFKMWLPELKRRGIETHVRNVFKDNCYQEVLADPNVDRIIIGIDNLGQLREDIEG